MNVSESLKRVCGSCSNHEDATTNTASSTTSNNKDGMEDDDADSNQPVFVVHTQWAFLYPQSIATLLQ